MIRRRSAACAAAVALLILSHAGPASAVTYREWDRGVASSFDTLNMPRNSGCISQFTDPPPGINATACFVPHGDYFYVKDMRADGKSAVAYWVELDGSRRTGACVNSLGYNTWARCNKDFVEGRRLSIRAGTYNGTTGVINDSSGTLYCFTSTEPGCSP